MLHKNNKHFKTGISTIKRVRRVLVHASLATHLGLQDEENDVIVRSTHYAIQEDEEWNFDEACWLLRISTRAGDRKNTYQAGNFSKILLRALTYFFDYTLAIKSSSYNKVRLEDIYFILKIQSQTPFPIAYHC